MKRRGSQKKPAMKARTVAPRESKVDKLSPAIEQGFVTMGGMKAPKRELKGVVIIEPEENNLIALLDAGNLEEFRRQLDEGRQQRRKQMFARVISGRSRSRRRQPTDYSRST